MGTISRSGRMRSNCAARRGEDVPTLAPLGKAARESAPISRSRTSARGSMAQLTSSAGRSVSTSFIEWTEALVLPASRAWSSSLVHSALPPASANGRSAMRSPLVVMGTISTRPSSQWWATSSAAAAMRACASASGDPRVPSLRKLSTRPH